MSNKTHIVSAIGERFLLVPSLLNEALAANDRAKYLLTLLQTAKLHADSPETVVPDLNAERLASGASSAVYDTAVAETVSLGADMYAMPGAAMLCAALRDNLLAMIAPFEAAQKPETVLFQQRLQALSGSPWCGEDDSISGAMIASLTSGDSSRGDSVHLLIMEMHRSLNSLQNEIATESVDGALTYGLKGEDRALVAAFMKGVNRTRPLKFEHPGLGSTATRIGGKLIIQNDIGTTDAHVLVVRVDGTRVAVTCTDNHLPRLLFFQGMFAGWDVMWGDVRSLADQAFENGGYHLCVGSHQARNKGDLKAYLAHLGSRLVFLIDWNRARKRLQILVPKEDALSLLSWCAANDIGHMGFLKAGGERMIFDALQFAAGGNLTYGVTLAELLGREAALAFLRFIFKACTRGLLDKRPLAMIRDEARVELSGYYHNAQQNLLDLASNHAALAVEIASGIRDGLLTASNSASFPCFEMIGQRAKEWERKADDLVTRARELAKLSGQADAIRQLLETADDITDELEEAAFHLTLLKPEVMEEEIRLPLAAFARLLVEGAQEYLKAIENARGIHRSGSPEDMHDFLKSIHRITVIEQESDTVERAVRKALVNSHVDYRQVFVIAETAKKLESSADALMHTGMILRDQILGRLMES
ncbi:MAG: DUF47 family protein [Desulfuromonadales bacterium]|nr:DUF47 family protein [Desulfuromonadales bacterium]